MKVVILAGGLGSRLSEETYLKPKPMVEIGGMPIIWHIMKIFSHYGFNDFIICAGYKSYVFKEFFSNYFLHMSDVLFDIQNNSIKYLNNNVENWKISVIDTGISTMTGGRIKRIEQYIDSDDFFMTYGDGLADVDINDLLSYHRQHKKLATVTASVAPGRFGGIKISKDSQVINFHEKPAGDGNLINGGFFVLNKKVLNLIDSDNTTWEQEPMSELTRINELMAYKHFGFWHPMDTLRDKNYLESLWNKENPPWKKWQC